MTSFLKRLFGVSADQTAATSSDAKASVPTEEIDDAIPCMEATPESHPPTATAPAKQAASGGVYLTGESISVGGDIVGGNKYGEYRDAVAIDTALEPIENEIEFNVPVDLKIEALRQLYTIGEWAKRYEPDLVAVGKALKWLIANTPQLTIKLRCALTNSVFPRSIRELTIVLLPEATVEFS